MHIGLSRIGLRQPSSFGAVYDPGYPLPAAELPIIITTHEVPDEPKKEEQKANGWLDVIGRLYALSAETDDEKAECAKLSKALSPLLSKAAKLETRIRERIRAVVEKDWDRLRKECRAQQRVIHKLQAKAQAAEARVQSSIESQNYCFTNLQAANSARLPKYFTDSEAAEREAIIEKAKAELQEAQKQLSHSVGARFTVNQELEAAQQKMSELGTAEQRVRNALLGREHYDAELGLSTKASV